MVKRSIPERIGSGLLAVAVAFLCVFWSLRPVRVHAVDDFSENVINYALNDLVKPLSETVITEYTSLDPTTLKIAEAELSFATHIAFSSLERDLAEQGVNFDPSFTGWNNLTGFYYFDSGDGSPELQVGTISWKGDVQACRVKFASGSLGAFKWCSSSNNKIQTTSRSNRFTVNTLGLNNTRVMQYWLNLIGFDSPFGFSSATMQTGYFNNGLQCTVRASSQSIPVMSASSPFWVNVDMPDGGYYNQNGELYVRALSDLTPFQFPDTGTIDPQTNYQAVLDDMLTTYGHEQVDKIWVPADFNNIPPVFDQFVFPGNLPGVTFPDVNIPETTLPETLWNSLAFYFQTFDQVANETGAKPVLIVFLIIALLCVMLKI